MHAVQLGWCLVDKLKLVTNETVEIMLPPGASLSEGAVDVHGLTREHLQEEGAPPEVVFQEFGRHLKALLGKGVTLVGHNLLRFDTNVLDLSFKRYGIDLRLFCMSPIIDTGLIFKARNNRLKRTKTENIWEFGKRIAGLRVHGKWNLDFCLQHFGIEYTRLLHDSGEDCSLTRMLLQAMLDNNWLEDIGWDPVAL